MPQRQMLINYVPGEECRIAINEDGRLEELYHERASVESHVGNIYKGRITNVEPAIQAAFVDFGTERNGFLHITDLHPKFFPGSSKEKFERVGKKTPHRERPLIQNCLKRGQEIIVQVLKEGIGTKGPTLTSYLSIPGRYLVMMPDMQRLGVSRKVEDDDARREIRNILDELETPDGFGFIVRTAGIGRNKTELKRDLAYLTRLWKTIDKRRKQVKIGELYVESDLIIRTLRDLFSTDIERVIIDHPAAAKRASDFLGIINPRARSKVFVYNDPTPLFNRFGIEKQIDTIHAHTVPMPGGGSLVIDQTEALVAIDVNSGRMRDNKDAETTAFKTNQEAVDEICRQLRLRDMGGVVVCDFIDMRDPKRRRTIESKFRDNLKNDRAKTKVLPINQFGILALTRQRMRPSLNSALFTTCTHCDGDGVIKNPESVVLHVMRRLALVIHRPEVVRVELAISPDVAFQLLNKKRKHLVLLEQKHKATVLVRVHGKTKIDEVEIIAYDDRGGIVNVDATKQNLDNLCLIPVSAKEDLPEELLQNKEDEITHVEPVGEELEGDSHLSVDLDGDQITSIQAPSKQDAEEGKGRKRRRRRGGRRRNKNRDRDNQPQADGSQDKSGEGDKDQSQPTEKNSENKPQAEDQPQESAPAQSSDSGDAKNESISGASRKRRRRRRGRGRDRDRDRESQGFNQPQSAVNSDKDQAPKPQQNKRPDNNPSQPQSENKPQDNKSADTKPQENKSQENKPQAKSDKSSISDTTQVQADNSDKPQVNAQADDKAKSEDKPKTTKKKTVRKKTTRKKTTKKVASKTKSGDNAPQTETDKTTEDKPASRGYTNRRKRSTTRVTKDSIKSDAAPDKQPEPASSGSDQ